MLRAMPQLLSNTSTALLGDRVSVSLVVDVNSIYSSQSQLTANVYVNEDPFAASIKLVKDASNQSVYTGSFFVLKRASGDASAVHSYESVAALPGDSLLVRMITVPSTILIVKVADEGKFIVDERRVRRNGILRIQLHDLDVRVSSIQVNLTIQTTASVQRILALSLSRDSSSVGSFSCYLFLGDPAYDTGTLTYPANTFFAGGLIDGDLINCSARMYAGSIFLLHVIDYDQNLDTTQSRDIISVNVHSLITNTSSIIYLVEDDVNSGQFHGELYSMVQGISPDPSQNLSQVLFVNESDQVVIVYHDVAPFVAVQRNVTVLPSQTGNLHISSSFIGYGSNYTVTVLDTDAYEQYTSVAIFMQTPSATYQYQAFRSPSESGVFSLSFSIARGASDLTKVSPCDNQTEALVLVQPVGDLENVTFTYRDQAPSMHISQSVRTCETGNLQVYPSSVGIGQTLYVQLSDSDAMDAQEVLVKVSNLRTGSEMILTLHKLENASFHADIRIVSSADSSAASSIVAQLGDTVRVTYEDRCPCQFIFSESSVFTVGSLSMQPKSLQSGSRLEITVMDADVNSNPLAVDTTRCECVCSQNKQLIVTLYETTVNSGIFTAFVDTQDYFECTLVGSSVSCQYVDSAPLYESIESVYILQSANATLDVSPTAVGLDGVVQLSLRDLDLQLTSHVAIDVSVTFANTVTMLQTLQLVSTLPGLFEGQFVCSSTVLSAGAKLLFKYQDLAPRLEHQQQVDVLPSVVGQISCFPNPVGLNTSLYIAVVDADLNLNSLVIEQATVNLAVQQNVQAITLVETSASSDVFTANVYVATSHSLPSELPVIDVAGVNVLTVSYADKAPRGARTVAVQVVQSALGTLTTLPTFIELGQETSVYLVDSDNMDLSAKVSISGPSFDPSLVQNGLLGEVNLAKNDTSSYQFVGKVTAISSSDYATLRLNKSISLNTLRQFMPADYGDVFTLTYRDLKPLQTVHLYVSVVTRGLLTLGPLKTDGVLNITVYDRDRNLNVRAVENINVTVRNLRDNQSKVVSLTEKSANASTFTGLLYTSSADSVQPSSIFPSIKVGDNVEVTYIDPTPYDAIVRKVKVTQSSIGVLSSNCSLRMNVEDSLWITVVDADMNSSPYLEESVSVTVTNLHTGELEHVTLLETSLNSVQGEFTGLLLTKFGTLNDEDDNGVLDIKSGDLITIVYGEVAPARDLSVDIKVATLGKLSLSPPILSTNDTVSLVLSDFDLNINMTGVDIGSALLQSSSGSAAVILTETGVNSSLFTGNLQLFSLTELSAVTATYQDQYPQATVQASARVAVKGKLSYSPPDILPNSALSITLIDKDLNVNTTAPDFASVNVSSFCYLQFIAHDGSVRCQKDFNSAMTTINASDKVSLNLKEISDNIGVFTGVVLTETTHSQTANHFWAPPASRIEIDYFDAFPLPSVVEKTGSYVKSPGILYTNDLQINENSALTLTLVDSDGDVTSGADHLYVYVVGPSRNSSGAQVIEWLSTGDQFELIETGGNTGTFTGSIPTRSYVPALADKTFVPAAQAGVYLTASYRDASPPNFVSSLTFRVSSLATVIVEPTNLAPSGSLFVQVKDADLNTDPLRVDVSSVTLVGTFFSTTLVQITETSQDSSIFTATIKTSVNQVSGAFYAPQGSVLTVNYLDSRPLPSRNLSFSADVSHVGLILLDCSTFLSNYCTITVYDQDLNTQPQVAETVTNHVVVYKSGSSEMEAITLQEIALDKQTFTGTLRLKVLNVPDCNCRNCLPCSGADCCASSNDGTLFVAQGSSIQAVYYDSSPHQTASSSFSIPTNGTISFSSSSYVVGNPFTLIVTDADLIVANILSVTVTLQSLQGTTVKDEEQVTLTYSSTTRQFAGVINSVGSLTGAFSSGNGVIEISKGNSLIAKYQDQNPSMLVTAQSPSALQFRGVLGVSPYPLISSNDVLTITLIDPDLDTSQLPDYVPSWTSQSSTAVRLSSCQLLHNFTSSVCSASATHTYLTLRENANTGGVFTGTVEMWHWPQVYAQTDVLFDVPLDGQIIVTYIDQTMTTIVEQRVTVSQAAKIVLDKGLVTIGGAIAVTVVDPDIIVQDPTITRVRVNISTAQENLQVYLDHTSARSGHFAGSFRVLSSLQYQYDEVSPFCPHVTQFLGGLALRDIVAASYKKSFGQSVIHDSVALTSQMGYFKDFSPQVSKSQDSITITVVDSDLNDNPFTIQSNLAGRLFAYRDMKLCSPSNFPSCEPSRMADGSSFFSCSSQDSTTCTAAEVHELYLTETNYNSSRFTASLDTRVFSTDSIYRLAYKGPVDHPGGGLAEGYIRRIDQPNLTVFGSDKDSQFFSVGENITIMAFDASANVDSCTSDLVVASVRVVNQVDIENVTLVETSHNSSTFTGSIATRSGVLADVARYNGILTFTSYSNVLAASYAQAPLEHQTTASDAGSLDPTYSILLAGSTLSITLTDRDVTANTLPVALSTSKDSERESTTLQRCTSCTAGTFVGYINTLLDASRGRSDDGVMNVLDGDVLTVEYQDQRPRNTRSRKIRVATRGRLSIAPALPALNDYLSITLTDSDLDTNTAVAETVLVSMDKVPVPDKIDVTLREIGLSAGIFTGNVLLTDSPNNPAQNVLSSCQAGDTVTVSDQLFVVGVHPKKMI
eukprot:746090-Hanusia_phi.AAC.7